jgi:hypothetical protein
MGMFMNGQEVKPRINNFVFAFGYFNGVLVFVNKTYFGYGPVDDIMVGYGGSWKNS